MFLFRASDKKGFTLIELMVVIAIIGILLTIVFGAIDKAREKARDNERISDIQQIHFAIQQYYDACGQYPYSLSTDSLSYSVYSGSPVQCVINGNNITLGTYISQIPTDPSTGMSYHYYHDDVYNGVNGQCLGTQLENPADLTPVTKNDACHTDNSGADTDNYKIFLQGI